MSQICVIAPSIHTQTSDARASLKSKGPLSHLVRSSELSADGAWHEARIGCPGDAAMMLVGVLLMNLQSTASAADCRW